MARGPDSTVGVYVHVPFCERVCPYCDFAVVAARPVGEAREARYVAAVLAELRARRRSFEGRRLESLYLGGGTPSLLEPRSVARLVAAVKQAFAPGREPEVTLEVNPSTLERARLPAFREAGVNRLSIGVQSFDDATLKRLGRAHRAPEADATLRQARRAGFHNLSLDLIFGVPGQDCASVERDLERAIAHAPEHVSSYGLTLEDGTPYASAVAAGKLVLPSEDDWASMWAASRRGLERAGIVQYELSNFARPGFESRHNRRYWERRPVLGLGVGACSLDPPTDRAPRGVRRTNPRSLDAYLRRIEAGKAAERGPGERLGEPTARAEAAFLSLRTTRGLRAEEFAQEFGVEPRGLYGAAIEELRRAGLLHESASGDLRLTGRGQILSDSVFERFV